jgi:hypothetical protein
VRKGIIIFFAVLFNWGVTHCQDKVFNNGPNVRVHIDKEFPFYFSGQKMELKILLISPAEYKLSTAKELVYINLINKEKESVFFGKVFAKNGTSSISIDLPSELPTGYYELIGYTNWMRNFDPSYFYREKISLFNSAEDLDAGIEESPEILFYPEGQKIVAGFSSHVAVHSTYPSRGESIAYINDDRGKRITDVSFDAAGWGGFYYLPQKNRSYFLNIVHNDKAIAHTLPAADLEGLTLSVANKKDKLQVILRKSKKHQFDSDVIILASMAGEPYYSAKAKFSKDFLMTHIPTKDLPQGVLNILILDQNHELLHTRAIYVNANGGNNIELNLTDTLLHLGEQADLSIDILNNNSALVNVKIVPEEAYQSEEFRLFESLSLGNTSVLSDVPSYTSLDNQLIAYTFDREVMVTPKTHKHLKESSLHLRGTLRDEVSLPDNTAIDFFIPSINRVYHTITDGSGKFEFSLLFDFIGQRSLDFDLYADDHVFDSPSITMDNDEASQMLALTGLPAYTSLVHRTKTQYLMEERIKKSYNYFLPGQRRKEEYSIDIGDKFTSDMTIDMEDYYAFPSVEAIIKEILPMVMLRKKDSGYVLNMYSPDIAQSNMYEPLIFINNQRIYDLQALLNLDPKNILNMKVIRNYEKISELRRFGRGGILAVETRQNQSIDPGQSSFAFNAYGLTSFRQSETTPLTVYAGARTPDFRSMLLWETIHNYESQRPIPFKASYRPGKYVVVVSVLGSNGKSSYATKRFEVMKP